MTRIAEYFSDADRTAIAAAVREAEQASGGEIVVFVCPACDDYSHAAWKGAAIGAIGAAGIAALVHWAGGFWGFDPVWMGLPALVGAAVGFLLPPRWATLRRWLASPPLLRRRAKARAAAAFLEAEVFDTQDRTGILLFLALFEREGVVLGDSGIDAKVEPGVWDEVARAIAAGMRDGKPAAAIVTGVRRCGEILARGGVARRADDRDELSNELRWEDE
jgi:putative membrane protein